MSLKPKEGGVGDSHPAEEEARLAAVEWLVPEPEVDLSIDLVVPIVLALWNFIVDIERAPVLLWQMGSARRRELARGVGSGLLFSPLLPEGEYSLDLAHPSERRIADSLIKLAGMEGKGAGFREEGYSLAKQGKVHSALKLWGEDLPRKGVWDVCYITPKGTIKWPSRLKLAAAFHTAPSWGKDRLAADVCDSEALRSVMARVLDERAMSSHTSRSFREQWIQVHPEFAPVPGPLSPRTQALNEVLYGETKPPSDSNYTADTKDDLA